MQQPTYKGEVMLLRWADSSTGGRTVTFTLEDTPDDPERHPFKGLPCGKDGQRFALVVVPIESDEHPNFEKPAEKPRQSWESMSRAQQAGILCSRPDFQRWLGVEDEHGAAVRVRYACNVMSRGEIDKHPHACGKFDALVSRYRQATGQQAEVRG